jgi:hypothetical protein
MPGSRSFNGTSGIIAAGGAMTNPTAGTGLTFGAWIYPTGYGENSLGRVFNFETGHAFLISNASGEAALRGVIDYATTDSDRRSVSSFIALNTWQFVAMTWTGGTAITDTLLYKGLFGGVPAEPSSYVTVTSTSGALQAFGDLNIGNRAADDRTFAGRIAHAFYINRPLTTPELAVAMYAPRMIPGLLTYHPLWGLASPEPDLAGGGHNGTVTTATAGDGGPPIGPFRRYAYGRYKEAAPAYAVSVLPYDTALGSVMSFPYDTLVGTAMSFPYDAQTGLRTVMVFPYDVAAGAVLSRVAFPYDTYEHPHVITIFPYDVIVTPTFTSPMRRSSQVTP